MHKLNMAFAALDIPSEVYFYVLPCVLLAWLIVSSFISWRRLRHVPGPFIASLTYLWVGMANYGGRTYWIWRDLHKKYGPIVRIGPNYLITDDPEILRRIGSARSTYHKDSWYMGARLNPSHDSMFSLLDTKAHDTIKAKVAGAYGGRETPDVEPGIDAQIHAAIDLIRRKYLSDNAGGSYRPLEFGRFASYLTLDVISKVAFGEEFGCLRNDSDVHGVIDEVAANISQIGLATDLPWLRRILFSPLFLGLFGPKPTATKGMGHLMGYGLTICHSQNPL